MKWEGESGKEGIEVNGHCRNCRQRQSHANEVAPSKEALFGRRWKVRLVNIEKMRWEGIQRGGACERQLADTLSYNRRRKREVGRRKKVKCAMTSW